MEQPLIELDHATVIRDGMKVLDDVSLRLELGRHSVILGPNGCGKSSFVKLIHRELYALARPQGTPPVRVFGQARWNVAELRTRLGVVSADQHAALNRLTGLDVEDAVVSGFWSSHGIPGHLRPEAHMLAQAKRMLDLMRVTHLRQRRLATLSAGEARRVLIARALVHAPQALLLDEPTTGLDIASRHLFLQLMREVADAGVTLVLVTHHLEEVLPETGQAVLLKHGRVLAEGAAGEVLTSRSLSALYDMQLQVRQQADGFRQLLPAR